MPDIYPDISTAKPKSDPIPPSSAQRKLEDDPCNKSAAEIVACPGGVVGGGVEEARESAL